MRRKDSDMLGKMKLLGLTPGAKIIAGLCFSAGNKTPLKVRPSSVLNSTDSRDSSIEPISLSVKLEEPGEISEERIFQLKILFGREFKSVL